MAAPCDARLREIAAPIPRVPPVTKATLPRSFSPVVAVLASVAVIASSMGSARRHGVVAGWADGPGRRDPGAVPTTTSVSAARAEFGLRARTGQREPEQ